MQLPTEIILEIAFKSDLKTLMHLSQTHSKYYNMIHTENFWENKLVHDYGADILQEKPLQLNMFQTYLDGVQMTSDQAVQYNRVDVLSMQHAQGYLPSEKAIQKAVGFGKRTVLDWLQKHALINPEKLQSMMQMTISIKTYWWMVDHKYI